MEEDSEILDWGNEDDEAQAAESHRSVLPQNGQDDAEDAVSLGGDEDDEIYPYKTVQPEDPFMTQQSTPRSSHALPLPTNARREGQHDSSGTSQNTSSRQSDSSQLRRSQSTGHMTHALPPKPVIAPPPFIPSTSTQTSTIASAMVPRERRSNGHPKPSSGSHDRDGGLPPDWEERYPRNGGGEPYYYNFKTHESTWVRPRIADSGPSSPAKERGQDIRSGVDRSPRRGTVDGDVHELRNEDKKHVSPGVPLRFEDRHYRPDGLALANSSSTSNNKQDSYARPAGLPPRPSSPRTVDKRRGPRSITPPPARRDARTSELAARSRRDIPPLVERDLSTRERRSPVQDREWDRSRNVVTLEDRGRGYSAELGTPRGRRLRDDPPSEHVRSDQGARDAYNPKSAPRPRSSPPHVHEQSPPRRHSEQDVYDQEHARIRADRPASPPSHRSRANDPYGLVDNIPQRRTRDYDPEYESDMKRRRVEDDSYRRRSSPDRLSTISPVVDRASFQTPLVEPPTSRKRVPLPPQSDRFREVAKGRSVAEPPSQAPSQVASQAPSLPPLRAMDSYSSPRGVASHPDVPSAPRSRIFAQPGREQDLDRRDNGRPRFDDLLTRQDEHHHDAMDVDYAPHVSRGGQSRGEIPPSRPRGSDRPNLDMQSGVPPKGPRAMSTSHGSFSQTPPSMSPVLPSNPIRVPEPVVPTGRMARAPPPHMKTDAALASRGPAPPSAPRGYGDYPDSRRHGRSQDFVEPRHRDPPSRSSRREEGAPVSSAGLNLSGLNIVPISQKRTNAPNSAAVEQPLRLPAVVPDRVPPQYTTEAFRAPPTRVAYVPDADPAYDDRLTPYDKHGRPSVSGGGNPTPPSSSPQFSMPPPNSLPPRPRDEPGGQGPRSGRQPRPVPDTSTALLPDEPRIWLTRAESQSLSRSSAREALPNRGHRGYDGIRDDTVSRYEVQRDYQALPPPGSVYDDVRPRRSRAVEPVSPPRARSSNSSDDMWMTDRAASLDGRSSHDSRMSQYDPPPDARRPPPRGRDDRGAPYNDDGSATGRNWSRGPRDDGDISWDQSMENPVDRHYPVHPDRVHIIGSQLPPPHKPLPYERRTTTSYSGRGRIEDAPYIAENAAGKDVELQRPPVRRGPSLLDRLNLSDSPPEAPLPLPTLRERVESPAKRTLPEVVGLPPRPSAETTYVAEMDALDASRGRGRRRRTKTRREPFE